MSAIGDFRGEGTGTRMESKDGGEREMENGERKSYHFTIHPEFLLSVVWSLFFFFFARGVPRALLSGGQ
jgi:hypothetical protein